MDITFKIFWEQYLEPGHRVVTLSAPHLSTSYSIWTFCITLEFRLCFKKSQSYHTSEYSTVVADVKTTGIGCQSQGF